LLFPALFAATTYIHTIRRRAATVCIALQDLQLPALVTLEIVDALFDNNIQVGADSESQAFQLSR